VIGGHTVAVTASLPFGTLTLLFSDVEGSTALLSRLGELYAGVLSTQRRIMREAITTWHGREMGTEGDSFFVVFESAGEALSAAVQAQRALSLHPWPDGTHVRVRMGIHTGEPARHEDGYVGMDVHRAARIAAAAHGGQVVISDATYQIVSPRTDGLTFKDLGWHRLKDIPQREHLHQVEGSGLDVRFAPLRTLGAGTSLPTSPTPIVGRDTELVDLDELIRSSGARLVTLTGPGGAGKTRLSIATADRIQGYFPDGVYFVPLESVDTADVMWTTVADAIGAAGDDRAPPALLDYLSLRRLLLVLDNLEQLPSAGDVVNSILEVAPATLVLATSRRPLHLVGEFEYTVPPLPVPEEGGESVATASECAAVQLFTQRARMVRPDFVVREDNVSDVAEICRRLDGLPLAIEIAAARIKLLGPQALRARLDESLALAAREGGRPARQRTLRDTIAWSYDLLTPEMRQFFRRLGAFGADFDLKAVGAVTECEDDPLDLIAEIVDVNLARVHDGPDGEPRVQLLQTIAMFAREKLAEAGELAEARRRHAMHYLAMIEDVAPRLRSGHFATSRDRIGAELDNLRDALAWALDDPTSDSSSEERLSIGLRICQALSWFWYANGYPAEGRRWLTDIVTAAEGEESAELMTSLHGLAVLLLQEGHMTRSRDMLERCLTFWRRTDDAIAVARELNSLSAAYRALGEPELARARAEESIAFARSAGDPQRLASALSNLALLEVDAGSPARAIPLLEECLVLDRDVGDDWGIAVDHLNLVVAHLLDGRTDEAYQRLRANSAAALALEDVDLMVAILEAYAMIFAERGEPVRAARFVGAAAAMRTKAGLPMPAADAVIFERYISKVRPGSDTDGWLQNVQSGAGQSAEDLVAEAHGGDL
jgi:predicted ATPase/class 3 adenylate cyclase